MKKTGRLTIPTDINFVEETKEIAKRWGADAVRDCDGVELPLNPKEIADKVYKAYFVVRGDNKWADENPDEWHRFYLMSDRVTATSTTLTIQLLKGYFTEQIDVDHIADPKRYWEVINRTTGELLNVDLWTYDQKTKSVTIKDTLPFHEYTVSFMAVCIWDPVQMYNYMTNDWDGEKQKMYDPRYPKTNTYVKDYLKAWLEDNPMINVIRFTTFLYQFTLVFNDKKKEKYVDWFGYSMSVSPKAIDDFEKVYGYRLRAEDIVDEGYYNNPFRNPKKAFLDYMEFTQKFVTKEVKELIEMTHKEKREAMMFLGDCWIGAEPYGKYFKELNLDAVVGSVGGGVTVRMLSDIEHVKYVEGRFLPYFFPDTFYEGNDPTIELNFNWLKARRAMMRKPLDRIGYGGYLELAAKFPDFVNRVEEISNEFRTIYDNVADKKPLNKLKVAVLNAWGKIRSWQSHMVAHELWYQQIYSYQGVLESLSGLPVETVFISFDDVIKSDILKDVDAVINVGSAYTAFSGGDYWDNHVLVSKIKSFIHHGGGFIGIGEPTAYQQQGRFFQLADVLGVDQEKGFSLSEDKYNIHKEKSHFIVDDLQQPIDYGEDTKNIYALEGTKVIDIKFSERFKRNVNVGEVKLASNDFGKGRSVYIAGLPYSFENSRLLLKSLLYATHKESSYLKVHTDDIRTECHYYEDNKVYGIVNNSEEKIETNFYDRLGNVTKVTLLPREVKWIHET